jgi:hypothetical protein
MAHLREKITIQPQPFQVGKEWHVKAIWPSGHPEAITGFKSEAEAKAWVAGNGAKAWVRSKGYPDD